MSSEYVKISDLEPLVSPETSASFEVEFDGDNYTYTLDQIISFSVSATLTGFSTASATVVTDTDSVLQALGKLQAQVNTKLASSAYTASDVLNKIKTVDGAGSGLDADLLDGLDSTAFVLASSKGAVNGIAPLDATGKIASTYLPSYVDDVLEFVNLAGFPTTGETGKIYTALDSNKIYRWSGSTYVEISGSPGSTDAVTEGSSNLYFTEARVRTTALTGFTVGTNATIAASDTVLAAFGKIQGQLNAKLNSASYTAADVLTKLLTVDGAGTNLDADLLDGQHGAYYLAWGNTTGKPTSLAGYGITDAYTKTEVDSQLASKADRAYVQSRGLNLVTNGTGLLGDNTNFSTFIFYPQEAFSANGSFRIDNPTVSRFNDEFIPVDASKHYILSIYAKRRLTGIDTRLYLGIACYDADNLQINPEFTTRIPGTDTELAAPLSPGDTTVTVVNSSNFVNGGAPHQRSLAIWGYKNSFGYQYPAYTYTRYTRLNSWNENAVNKTTHVITLNSPWNINNPDDPGGVWPAGTKVSNMQSGGTYKYIGGTNMPLTDDWTSYIGKVGGFDTTGVNDTYKFHPGTASIKLLFLCNYSGAGSSLFSNIEFKLDPQTELNAAIGATVLHTGNGYTKTQVDALFADFEPGGVQYTNQTFTATANQTVFNMVDPYVSGLASVYLDGILMIDGVDVDTSDGTKVTFTTGVEAGRLVTVIAYGAMFEVANAVPLSRTVTAGTGLNGGGALSGNITLSVDFDNLDARYLNLQTNAAKATATQNARFVMKDNDDSIRGLVILNKMSGTYDIDFITRHPTEGDKTTFKISATTPGQVLVNDVPLSKEGHNHNDLYYTKSQTDSAISAIDKTANGITDATTLGRNLVKASNAAAAVGLLRPGAHTPIVAVTGSTFNITSSHIDNFINVTRAAGSALTINVSGITAGWYCIVNVASTTNTSSTLTSSDSKTIDGFGTIRVYPNERPFTLFFNGTNFITLGRDRVVTVSTQNVSTAVAQVRFTEGFNDPEIREIEIAMQDVYGSTTMSVYAQFLTAASARITSGYSGTKGMSGTTTSFPYAAQTAYVANSVFTGTTSTRLAGKINLFQTALASGNWFWEYWFINSSAAMAKGHGNYLKPSFNGGANPGGIDIFASSGNILGIFDYVIKR